MKVETKMVVHLLLMTMLCCHVIDAASLRENAARSDAPAPVNTTGNSQVLNTTTVNGTTTSSGVNATSVNGTATPQAATLVNSTVNSTGPAVGNSTVNTTVSSLVNSTINSTGLAQANSTVNSTVSPLVSPPVNSTVNSTVSSLVNSAINSTGRALVNSTVNSTVPSQGNSTINSTGLAPLNNTANSTVSPLVNSTINSTVSPLVSPAVNSTVNSTGPALVNSTVNATVTSLVNSTINSTGPALVNSTVNSTVPSPGNSTINSTGPALVNGTVNSTVSSLVNSTVNSTVSSLVNSTINSTGSALGNGTVNSTVSPLVNSNVNSTAVKPDPACTGKPGELVFLLHNSSKVGGANFSKELDFTKHVINAMDVGLNATKVAAVSYDQDVTFPLALNQSTSKAEVLEALKAATFSWEGQPQIKLGLSRAGKNVFTTAEGGEGGPKTSQALVVLIHGHLDDLAGVQKAVQTLKDGGVTIVAVGVGGASSQELESIASQPANSSEPFHFELANFDALASVQEKVVHIICQDLFATPAVDQVRADPTPRNLQEWLAM